MRIFATISDICIVAILTALCVLSVTVAGIPPQLTAGIITTFVAAALCIVLAGRSIGDKVLYFHPAALLGIPLVLVSALSSANTHALMRSIFGEGSETGTLCSIALFAIAIAYGVLSSRSTARVFLIALVVSGVVATAGLTLSQLGVHTFGVIMSWPYTSIVFSLGAVLAAVLFDRESRMELRALYVIAGLGSLAGSVFALSPDAAILGAICAATFAGTKLLKKKGRSLSGVPFAAVLIGILLAAVAAFGTGADAPHGADGTYPSLQATEYIIIPLYHQSLDAVLLGTSPNSFPYAWRLYRPQQINQTSLWAFDPDSAYSTIVTFCITLGLLGVFALFLCAVVPLVMLIFYGYQARANDEAAGQAGTLEGCVIAATFLIYALVVYPIGIPLFVLTGLSIGFVLQLLITRSAFSPNIFRRLPVALVLLILGGGLCYIAGREYVGAWYHSRALVVLNTEGATAAIPPMEKTIAWWPVTEYLIDSSNTLAAASLPGIRPGELTSLQNGPGNTRPVDRAILYSAWATATDPRSYQAWLTRAALSVSLERLKFPDAKSYFDEAIVRMDTLSPYDPRVPYMRALFLQAQGDNAAALAEVQKALTLKTNYEEALKLKAQLQASS